MYGTAIITQLCVNHCDMKDNVNNSRYYLYEGSADLIDDQNIQTKQ